MKRTRDYFRGCLLGGAIGDALGWPVEFRAYREIVRMLTTMVTVIALEQSPATSWERISELMRSRNSG